jgi:hypothetical protein
LVPQLLEEHNCRIILVPPSTVAATKDNTYCITNKTTSSAHAANQFVQTDNKAARKINSAGRKQRAASGGKMITESGAGERVAGRRGVGYGTDL